MAFFNTTFLGYLLAFDFVSAVSYLRKSPANWIQALGAVLEAMGIGLSRESNTSLDLSLVVANGATFVVTSPVTLKEGWPMMAVAVDPGDPVNQWMRGTVQADVVNSTTFTLDVTSIGPTLGILSKWTIGQFDAVPPVLLSDPVGFINGGHGGASQLAALANLEVIHRHAIIAVASLEPAGVLDKIWLKDDSAPVGGESASWLAITVGGLAKYNGATWDEAPKLENDFAYDETAKAHYVFTAQAAGASPLWAGSEWNNVDQGVDRFSGTALTGTQTLDETIDGKFLATSGFAGPQTFTLPNPAINVAAEGISFVVHKTVSTSQVIFNVDGAGDIHDAGVISASISISGGTSRYFRVRAADAAVLAVADTASYYVEG